MTAFPPLIAHCIFHCIFNISTVKPHEFVKFVSVRLFFALYVVDPHQDFYMRIAMRISAYADHPHEPHGSATAWPTLVPMQHLASEIGKLRQFAQLFAAIPTLLVAIRHHATLPGAICSNRQNASNIAIICSNCLEICSALINIVMVIHVGEE